MVWKNLGSRRIEKEFRDRVTSRNMLTVWLPHGVHMVYAWMTEIKEYNIRAHVYNMLALRWTHGRLVIDMRTGHGY